MNGDKSGLLRSTGKWIRNSNYYCLRSPMFLDVFLQGVVHACLPAIAGRLEVLDYLGAVANGYRNFRREFLRPALAGKTELALGPIGFHCRCIVRIVWAGGVLQLFRG